MLKFNIELVLVEIPSCCKAERRGLGLPIPENKFRHLRPNAQNSDQNNVRPTFVYERRSPPSWSTRNSSGAQAGWFGHVVWQDSLRPTFRMIDVEVDRGRTGWRTWPGNLIPRRTCSPPLKTDLSGEPCQVLPSPPLSNRYPRAI